MLEGSDMQVKIDGVEKTLVYAHSHDMLTAQWNELGDVRGTMRPIKAHRLPRGGLAPGVMCKRNGHTYEVVT